MNPTKTPPGVEQTPSTNIVLPTGDVNRTKTPPGVEQVKLSIRGWGA